MNSKIINESLYRQHNESILESGVMETERFGSRSPRLDKNINKKIHVVAGTVNKNLRDMTQDNTLEMNIDTKMVI